MKTLFTTSFTLILCLTLHTVEAKTLCTLVSDPLNNTSIIQEGQCDEQVTPASTFKLVLSLIGFDSGYLINKDTPALPYLASYAAEIESWKQTTTPSLWMANSVVWYSQQLTQWLGQKQFTYYVNQFQYGNQDLSGDAGKNNGLTHAWLSSSLKISPLEQLSFLKKLVTRQLKVSDTAYEQTEQLTLITTLDNGWEIHGKTGSGRFPSLPENSTNAVNLGWFIGWAIKDAKVIIFVHNLIQDNEHPPVSAGMTAKKEMMLLLPTILQTL
ncbi:class D beta-lactamase [Methylomonas sp. AM2-LC]|uniref:class D beta-lactamase n=1 Tax=Methylomonas sp. AM2-LC TaxID=3153301 RepID=UPI003267793E